MTSEYISNGDRLIFENYVPYIEGELVYIAAAGHTLPSADYQARRDASVQDISYSMEYVLEGKGVVIYDGERRAVGKGDFLMWDNTREYRCFSDENEPLSKIWINVSGSFIEKNIELFGLPHLVIQRVDAEENILAVHKLLGRRTAEDTRAFGEQLCIELFRILFKIQGKYNRIIENDDRFTRIRKYIKTHIMDGVTVEKVCTDNFISEITLYRLFKSRLGVTPTDYIKNEKINIACRMLKLTDMDISEISKRLGFYDGAHFSRTFCAVMNTSPSAYRKSVNRRGE